MTDELELDRDAPWPRWLRFRSACRYVGIQPGTMSLKLAAGKGPPIPSGAGIAGQDLPRDRARSLDRGDAAAADDGRRARAAGETAGGGRAGAGKTTCSEFGMEISEDANA